jgi:hypothetical protein
MKGAIELIEVLCACEETKVLSNGSSSELPDYLLSGLCLWFMSVLFLCVLQAVFMPGPSNP